MFQVPLSWRKQNPLFCNDISHRNFREIPCSLDPIIFTFSSCSYLPVHLGTPLPPRPSPLVFLRGPVHNTATSFAATLRISELYLWLVAESESLKTTANVAEMWYKAFWMCILAQNHTDRVIFSWQVTFSHTSTCMFAFLWERMKEMNESTLIPHAMRRDHKDYLCFLHFWERNTIILSWLWSRLTWFDLFVFHFLRCSQKANSIQESRGPQ